VPALLGLLAAFGYGLSDFIAGMLSRQMHFAVVAVIAGAAAPFVTLVAVGVTEPVVPGSDALLWGAIGGAGVALGTLALFRGLGRGRMGIVAPVSALTAVVVPVILGVVSGDRPPVLAWIGVVLAVPAIWLVSSSGHEPSVARGAGPRVATSVSDGLLAGAGFAVLYISLKLAGDGSGLWPVLANEIAALVILVAALVLLLPTIERRRPSSRDVAASALVGIIGALATVSYFLAAQAGMLSIVAVLTSLYPAATVVLAMTVAHETVGRRQRVGLLAAGLAIVLIVS
jgi:uncharacterized membrane protein